MTKKEVTIVKELYSCAATWEKEKDEMGRRIERAPGSSYYAFTQVQYNVQEAITSICVLTKYSREWKWEIENG